MPIKTPSLRKFALQACGLFFTCMGLAFLATSAQAAPISATGWDVDFILGSGETYAAHQKPRNQFIWFADNSTVNALGFPASGAVTASGVDFQMQPFTGGANNAVYGVGTLTLDTPGKFSEISLLGSIAGTDTTPTMTLNFSDGPSTSPIPISFSNWISASAVSPNPRLTSNGTTGSNTGGNSVVTYDLAANSLSGFTLTSIGFTGTFSAVFALSGTTTSFTGEPVPEPSTLLLAAVGGVALLAARWRRRAAVA